MIEPDHEKDEHNSQVIAHGVADGINRSKISFFDRRLLIIYILFVAFIVGSLTWQNHQSDNLRDVIHSQKVQQDKVNAGILHNCESQNAQAVKFNAEVDQLIAGVNASTVLSAADKAQRVAAYSDLHEAIQDCQSLVAK